MGKKKVDNVNGWREGNGKRGKRTNARSWWLQIGVNGRLQLLLLEGRGGGEEDQGRRNSNRQSTDKPNMPLSHLLP